MSASPFLSGLSRNEIGEVVRALAGPRIGLAEPLPELPGTPGLYAVHGSASAWREFGLGDPPDDRPLYVGKSESSLQSRDVSTHFGDGRTGSSTVRRSFAALLHDTLGLRGVPRNRETPERCANYGLVEQHDTALTRWMRTHLELAVWEKDRAVVLDELETDVLGQLLPPVNLAKIATPWKQQVGDARKVMTAEARAWARERGFDC